MGRKSQAFYENTVFSNNVLWGIHREVIVSFLCSFFKLQVYTVNNNKIGITTYLNRISLYVLIECRREKSFKEESFNVCIDYRSHKNNLGVSNEKSYWLHLITFSGITRGNVYIKCYRNYGMDAILKEQQDPQLTPSAPLPGLSDLHWWQPHNFS